MMTEAERLTAERLRRRIEALEAREDFDGRDVIVGALRSRIAALEEGERRDRSGLRAAAALLAAVGAALLVGALGGAVAGGARQAAAEIEIAGR